MFLSFSHPAPLLVSCSHYMLSSPCPSCCLPSSFQCCVCPLPTSSSRCVQPASSTCLQMLLPESAKSSQEREGRHTALAWTCLYFIIIIICLYQLSFIRTPEHSIRGLTLKTISCSQKRYFEERKTRKIEIITRMNEDDHP